MPAPTSTCHGVRRPEYRPVPGLGGSAGDRSDDQCPDPIGPGKHAAPFGWPDANQGVGSSGKCSPDSSSRTPLPSSAMYI